MGPLAEGDPRMHGGLPAQSLETTGLEVQEAPEALISVDSPLDVSGMVVEESTPFSRRALLTGRLGNERGKQSVDSSTPPLSLFERFKEWYERAPVERRKILQWAAAAAGVIYVPWAGTFGNQPGPTEIPPSPTAGPTARPTDKSPTPRPTEKPKPEVESNYISDLRLENRNTWFTFETVLGSARYVGGDEPQYGFRGKMAVTPPDSYERYGVYPAEVIRMYETTLGPVALAWDPATRMCSVCAIPDYGEQWQYTPAGEVPPGATMEWDNIVDTTTGEVTWYIKIDGKEIEAPIVTKPTVPKNLQALDQRYKGKDPEVLTATNDQLNYVLASSIATDASYPTDKVVEITVLPGYTGVTMSASHLTLPYAETASQSEYVRKLAQLRELCKAYDIDLGVTPHLDYRGYVKDVGWVITGEPTFTHPDYMRTLDLAQTVSLEDETGRSVGVFGDDYPEALDPYRRPNSLKADMLMAASRREDAPRFSIPTGLNRNLPQYLIDRFNAGQIGISEVYERARADFPKGLGNTFAQWQRYEGLKRADDQPIEGRVIVWTNPWPAQDPPRGGNPFDWEHAFAGSADRPKNGHIKEAYQALFDQGVDPRKFAMRLDHFFAYSYSNQYRSRAVPELKKLYGQKWLVGPDGKTTDFTQELILTGGNTNAREFVSGDPSQNVQYQQMLQAVDDLRNKVNNLGPVRVAYTVLWDDVAPEQRPEVMANIVELLIKTRLERGIKFSFESVQYHGSPDYYGQLALVTDPVVIDRALQVLESHRARQNRQPGP